MTEEAKGFCAKHKQFKPGTASKCHLDARMTLSVQLEPSLSAGSSTEYELDNRAYQLYNCRNKQNGQNQERPVDQVFEQ